MKKLNLVSVLFMLSMTLVIMFNTVVYSEEWDVVSEYKVKVANTTLKTGSQINTILGNLVGGEDRKGLVDEIVLSPLMFASDDGISLIESGDKDAARAKYDSEKKRIIYYITPGVKIPKNLSLMFSGFTSMEKVEISKNLDMSKVEDMRRMFYNCQSLKDLDFTKFVAPEVTDLSDMFYNCQSLESIDLSRINAKKVTTLQSTFGRCTNCKEIDISGIFTSNCENIKSMFDRCTNLKTIKVEKFDKSKIDDLTAAVFTDCDSLVGGAGTVFNKDYISAKMANIDTKKDAYKDANDKGVDSGYFTYSEHKLSDGYNIDRDLTDTENTSFITRNEFVEWKNSFMTKLEALDENATNRIFDNMDFYDLQYVFTDNYKNPYDQEEQSSQYESYEQWRQEEIERKKQSIENK